MSVIARPAPSPSLPLPAIVQPDGRAYVDASFARFERVLVEVVPTLREPRSADPDRAFQRLGFLVETLTGIALGITIGNLAVALRRAFGSETARALDAALDATCRTIAPSGLDFVPPRFLADAASRPLVDTLGACLQARLRRAHPEARALVARLQHLAPPRAHGTLDVLAADDAAALVFGDHLALGWRTFVAVTTGGAAPRGEGPRWARANTTWQAWRRRALGLAVAPALHACDQPTLVAAGYLLRIG